MKLNGIKKESVEIEVSPQEVFNEMVKHLLDKAEIKDGWFLKDSDPGWFYEDEDRYHGSASYKRVQEATAEQIKVYQAVKFLTNFMIYK